MFVEVGKGIKYSIDDNGLMTIVVDTSKDFGLSGSGKSTMIATSSGNQKINVNGEDIWQTATLEALDGLGLESHFIDVFFSYHTLMGEAHCGTNFERSAETLSWWTQD